MRSVAIACIAAFGLAVASSGAYACGYGAKTAKADKPVTTVQLPQTKAPSSGS